ncbi:MAG: hypothetical protein J5850_02640 [Clostridia bacterium]|nr:hypothetical protein [Clostridia bacterium]
MSEKKNNSRKGAIIFISIIAALAIILPLLNLIDFDAILKKRSDDAESSKSADVTYRQEMFSEPDYDRDFKTMTDYLDRDRYLHYKQGNEAFIIDKVNVKSQSDVCVMWYNYFEALKAGDAKALNALYTEDCIRKNGRQGKFSPQPVYDISVEMISENYLENGDSNGDYAGYTVYYFDVNYCIWDNDGTFRRDIIIEDSSRTLRFEVLEKDRTVKINNYYAPNVVSSVRSNTGISKGVIIAVIAVAAVLIIAAVLLIVFIRPKKKKTMPDVETGDEIKQEE